MSLKFIRIINTKKNDYSQYDQLMNRAKYYLITLTLPRF